MFSVMSVILVTGGHVVHGPGGQVVHVQGASQEVQVVHGPVVGSRGSGGPWLGQVRQKELGVS